MFVHRLVVLGLVAVAAVGCPRTVVPQDAGPDPGPQLQSCSDVSECPGFVDGAATQTVRCDGVCLIICNGVDEVCPAGFFCDRNGTCDIGCRPGPGQCPDGQLCQNGTCSAGGGEDCATKCDCQPGEICSAGQCVPAGATCVDGADCPRGPLLPTDDCEAFSCNAFTDQCFDPTPTPCTASTECVGRPGCTGGAVCTCTTAGACVPDVDCTPQTENAACGADNYCDGNGDCQALPSCTNDTECSGFGLTCNEGRGKCERPQSCTISADCTTPPNTFCATGFCAIGTCNNGAITCQANQDCSADGRCVAAGTGTACTGDVTCPADQFCNFTLATPQCAIGCRDNSSCPSGNSCNGQHQCAPDGAGGNGGFGDTCPNGDADCQSPLICGTFTGTCAEVCATDTDCIACSASNGAAGCSCSGLFAAFCVPN